MSLNRKLDMSLDELIRENQTSGSSFGGTKKRSRGGDDVGTSVGGTSEGAQKAAKRRNAARASSGQDTAKGKSAPPDGGSQNTQTPNAPPAAMPPPPAFPPSWPPPYAGQHMHRMLPYHPRLAPPPIAFGLYPGAFAPPPPGGARHPYVMGMAPAQVYGPPPITHPGPHPARVHGQRGMPQQHVDASVQMRTGFKVKLANVPAEVTAKELADVFGHVSFQRVESVDLWRDAQGRATGEATVIFNTLFDAENAVYRYNGGNLNGQLLTVTYDGAA